MRLPVATIFLLFAGNASAQLSSPPKLYAVVFQATVSASGGIDTLKVSKVIDPASGSTHPVDVSVPKSYVAAARAFLSKRPYSTNPKEFFTYTFYNPSQPARADIDPKLAANDDQQLVRGGCLRRRSISALALKPKSIAQQAMQWRLA